MIVISPRFFLIQFFSTGFSLRAARRALHSAAMALLTA
jgi:hypothetical protein